MQLKILRVILLTSFGCAFSSAHATMLEQLDTKRLTHESKWIHVGEVTSKWSSYDPTTRMVYTYTKLRVDQTLKGAKAGEVLIRTPGGQSQKLGMVVHGVAHFMPGERALVFLSQDSDGAPSLVGMAQGKFRIFKSSKNGEEMALQQVPSNVEFVTRNSEGQIRQVVSMPTEQRIPLKQVMADIESALSGDEKAVSN